MFQPNIVKQVSCYPKPPFFLPYLYIIKRQAAPKLPFPIMIHPSVAKFTITPVYGSESRWFPDSGVHREGVHHLVPIRYRMHPPGRCLVGIANCNCFSAEVLLLLCGLPISRSTITFIGSSFFPEMSESQRNSSIRASASEFELTQAASWPQQIAKGQPGAQLRGAWTPTLQHRSVQSAFLLHRRDSRGCGTFA